MLKWLKNLSERLPFSGGRSEPLPQRRVLSRDEHPISRKHISRGALDVLYGLQKGGFEAYLVGGGVRDLLLGKHPKDFDVATNATPEEVRGLFRRSRIIGRRFRIVHVMCGAETIEVTTFRGNHGPAEEIEEFEDRKSGQSAAASESGMLLRDNVYGTVEEDAIRRDFTVNALYYTVKDFTVHDFANGMDDLRNRVLRIIGDPERRYREDPVRMLRAVRFAAKLDFALAPTTAEPIPRLAELLQDVAAARMFDEVIKLLMCGHGVETFALMRQYGLFEPLFPMTEAAIREGDPYGLGIIQAALRNTDERIHQGKSVTPAFLYAALLWPAQQRLCKRFEAEGDAPAVAFQRAAHEVLLDQGDFVTIPKRFSIPLREIWELQPRLPRRQGARAEATFAHPRFRAAYDFLLLREAAGENTGGLGKWWTEYQRGAPENREQLMHAARDAERGEGAARKRRPRRRNRRYSNGPA